jgi:diaminopimelate decarboxylase
MSHFHLRAGVTHCEDVALPEIAMAVGTPAFVYSAGAMRAQAQAPGAALAPLDDPPDSDA